ncbi:MAG TPA: hypothetical protein VIU64_17550 [Polyangia bacterium]
MNRPQPPLAERLRRSRVDRRDRQGAAGARPSPPPGEAPLLCEDCSEGCLGHRKRCDSVGCECPALPGHVPVRYRSTERRAVALANSGYLGDDRALVHAALLVAAERYERDAALVRGPRGSRLRQHFRGQAVRCRVIADAIAP